MTKIQTHSVDEAAVKIKIRNKEEKQGRDIKRFAFMIKRYFTQRKSLVSLTWSLFDNTVFQVCVIKVGHRIQTNRGRSTSKFYMLMLSIHSVVFEFWMSHMQRSVVRASVQEPQGRHFDSPRCLYRRFLLWFFGCVKLVLVSFLLFDT